MNQGAAFCDRIAARLNEAVSRVDGDDGRDEELEPYLRQLPWEESTEIDEDPQPKSLDVSARHQAPRLEPAGTGKSWMYANSRLPPHLPPLTVYMPTWRLLCMAARASQDVYQRPRSGEREDYIDADWRQGTKAMVLKSSPIDDQNLLVFAIRGSQLNAIDWLVNLRPAPTAPNGFLDDAGNACHAGFLSVARSMIAPVAARLRHLLEQDPSRASSSLLITGHSAGGAVAALLFMHMLSTTIESELSILTGCFKRVHCVTFGAPPVSFLPLQKPAGKRFEKSVFLSFINEGDLVTRFSDKAYVGSVARLLAAPAPKQQSALAKMSKQKLQSTALPPPLPARPPVALPRWPVPPATLSNAGRLVLLREKQSLQKQQGRPVTEAVSTSDQQLREVIFGDIAAHAMSVYKKRIDELAIAAVTGQ
ncbi:alpha/beta-hydrolase [Polychaeton citri CBS 116435]|uniref:Alpha/beta-hydrolase n=1 Tax=Polychaeton citri CBS 116435 TaxID=1314669 RepID=A0A9P4PZ67_9PEZI|nr:alpha/beta-hydrolase [Polychaeton citri CBS 116435]